MSAGTRDQPPAGAPGVRWARWFSPRGWLGLATLCLGLSAVGLATPWLGRLRPGAPLELLLVDLSPSVTAARPGLLGWLRSELLRACGSAAERGARVELWVFSTAARRLFPAGDAEQLARGLLGLDSGAPLLLEPQDLEREASDLGAALASVARSLEAARVAEVPARLELWSDGLTEPSGERGQSLLGRWAAAGCEVQRHALPAPSAAVVRLDGLAAAPELAPGEALELEVRYSLGELEPAELLLEVRLEGPAGEREELQPIALPRAPGQQHQRLRLPVSMPAPFELQARLVAAAPGAGALVLGAGGSSFVRPRGQRLVGLVGPAAQAIDPGPAPSHLRWWPLTPQQAERRLPDLDALVWWDRSLNELPPEVEGFLSRGGGLLTLGGASQLVSAARARQLAFLPLLAAPAPKPPRDLVILFDASGSMAGAPAAAVQQAALRLAEILPPEDGLVLRWFTEALARPVRLPSGNRQAAAQALLSLSQPRGGTALFYSLEQYVEERERAVAGGVRTDELVILLTDGRDNTPPDDPVGRAAEARARLARARAELRVVALGERPELELLAPLAGGEQSLLLSPTPARLEALLLRLGAEERLLPGPIEVAALPTELLSGPEVGAGRARPPLELALRARVAAAAEVFWSASDGAPLGAVQRVGLGRAVSLAFAPGAECAPLWLGLPELSGLLGFVAERPARRPARLSLEGPRLVLELEGAGWPPVLAGRLEPRPSRGTPAQALTLWGEGPGRWSAPLPQRFLRAERDSALELLLDPGSAPDAPSLPWLPAREPRELLWAQLEPLPAPATPPEAAPPLLLASDRRDPPVWAFGLLAAGALCLLAALFLSLGRGPAGLVKRSSSPVRS